LADGVTDFVADERIVLGGHGADTVDATIVRSFKALANVSCDSFKSSLAFRATTLGNLMRKSLWLWGLFPSRSLTGWKFSDCDMTVKLGDLLFKSVCPKGGTLNIYNNPYFHEYDLVSFVCRTLEPGDTFIDVGAMGGLYTIIASKLVGEGGNVISVEPNPESLQNLRKNISLNELRNVILVAKAVGERTGRATLYYNSETLELTSVFKGEKQHSFEIDMATVDSIADGAGAVKILKIDTEGYDAAVLEGAKKTLQRTRFVIIETNDEKTSKALAEFGFAVETMRPSGYLLGTRWS